jgi:sugar O-acyltransferase (sialic acid O-acetyltransferase NeuD family)
LDGLTLDSVQLIIAIGDCRVRMERGDWACHKGFAIASAIHPRAVLAADTVVGDGSVVVAGSVVNPGARLGRHVIVNTGATVDHDCRISDGVHIAPGCHLAGNVEVGTCTDLGIGTTVKDRTKIGSHCMIGAGSVVIHDIPDGVVAYGVPARIVRENK